MWERLRLLKGSDSPGSNDGDGRASPPTGEQRSAEALYYHVAMKKLDAQSHDIESIESRASTLFTIGSTILPITAGVLTTNQTALGGSAVAKLALWPPW